MTIIRKKDFIKRVATATDVTMGDIEIILDAMITELENVVRDGDTLKVKGFGTLTSIYLPERNGYSVKEKKVIRLPAGHRRVNFKLSKNIKFPELGITDDGDEESDASETLTE